LKFQVLNLNSNTNCLFEGDDDFDGFVPKAMLSVPIFNRQHQVIGVAQLINKAIFKFSSSIFNFESKNALVGF
jgi:hypothetical protein